jgi:flagellar hook-associated protein 2
MAISSQGIGSGLDVNSIVTQLVAIEKQPLKTLQAGATKLQSQVSVYGTIKSQIATLQDAATTLAKDSSWAVQSATSSNVAAATVSVNSTASSVDFSLKITQLAKAQIAAMDARDPNLKLGAVSDSGTLKIQMGSWATGIYVAGDLVSVPVTGDDTYATIAAAINAQNAGVKAIVLTSGGKERLSLQSTSTGSDAVFQVTSEDGFAVLDSLVAGMSHIPWSNAAVEVNGLSLSSASNTMTNVVPGVTLSLLQEHPTNTTQISVVQDKPGIQTNIQAFADAYTALSKTLADATKYVPGGQSGALQGDTTTVGLQRLLRQMVGMVGDATKGWTLPITSLSKVGLELQTDGSLKVNSTSLKTAMTDMTGLQTLFTYVADPAKTSYDKQKDGFGVSLRELTKALLNTSGGASAVNKDNGFVTNKAAALQASITRNSSEQDKVSVRAAAVEKRLRVQYSALDAKMATMSSLSSYVTAQLAQWNKTTN